MAWIMKLFCRKRIYCSCAKCFHICFTPHRLQKKIHGWSLKKSPVWQSPAKVSATHKLEGANNERSVPKKKSHGPESDMWNVRKKGAIFPVSMFFCCGGLYMFLRRALWLVIIILIPCCMPKYVSIKQLLPLSFAWCEWHFFFDVARWSSWRSDISLGITTCNWRNNFWKYCLRPSVANRRLNM